MRSDMYIDAVLRKCALFNDCNLWANEPRLRPRAWLANFETAERPIAAVMLDHFLFFGAEAVDQMLMTGIRRLQATVEQFQGSVARTRFASRVTFVAVAGEDPNPTDSGLFFCRKARQILKLPDDRFVGLAEALSRADKGTPVVFLDDFIGSGDQMVATWERTLPGLGSFKSVSDAKPTDVSYISLVSTSDGYSRLRRELPNIRLIVSHVVDEEYSVRRLPKNPITPDIDDLQEKIDRLLEKYHPLLQLPVYFRTIEQRKYGYSKQGLLLAFDHSVPDCSLPILWAKGTSEWTPLLRRA